MDLKKGIENLVTESQIPEDVRKGFYDLGYNDEDINNQFNYHRQELLDPDYPEQVISNEDVYQYMRDHLADKLINRKKFQPTKETIWNDPKHPLYSIAPSEQNEEFLGNAIKELERNLQSPAHFKFYTNGTGATMGDSRKKLDQYRKALKYIKGE